MTINYTQQQDPWSEDWGFGGAWSHVLITIVSRSILKRTAKCRHCGFKNQAVNRVISECRTWVKKEYKNRRGCRKRWPFTIVENKMNRILRQCKFYPNDFFSRSFEMFLVFLSTGKKLNCLLSFRIIFFLLNKVFLLCFFHSQ